MRAHRTVSSAMRLKDCTWRCLALRESLDKSWLPKVAELRRLTVLEAKDRKSYIRSILYPARFIYTWD